MPLIACPDCGAEISTAAPSCPRCGAPSAEARLAQKDREAKSGWMKATFALWLIGGPILLVIWAVRRLRELAAEGLSESVYISIVASDGAVWVALWLVGLAIAAGAAMVMR